MNQKRISTAMVDLAICCLPGLASERIPIEAKALRVVYRVMIT